MWRGNVVVVGAVLLSAFAATPASAKVSIEVLSNRAEAISGGDALVAVKYPKGTRASRVRVSLNGKRVTGRFAVRPTGRFEGMLTGLRNGANTVVARVPGGEGARLTIRNHPIGGPVTAGPQIQPWTCFDGALDRQCNRPVELTFHYMPEGGSALQPYDPANPPSDVANTTTDQGKTVPFIVRQERGALDRDEFRIAVLYQPGKPWQPWAPQPGYNGKLVTFHGFSCDTHYQQAAAPDVLNEEALGRGFATMSHALNNAGHNCNIATQAESMIMAKERVAERYGPIRYTIGSGCSGGSLTQQQVANAYPGVYQGITPACSFTDAWSSAMLYVDYQLLRRYFENPGTWAPGVAWGPTQIAAVEGHPNPINAVTFTTAIASSGDPSRSCPGVPAEKVYDAQSNPRGVRCTLHDYMVNIFGRRAKDGFAQRPFDNVGIEYGRKALAAGAITPAQFADVNDKLGGWDIDYNATRGRVASDRPAMSRAYRSGAINQADQLDKVAIIDLRGPDPGAFHDVYRTYAMRARLMREHGTAANQVLWRGQVPLMGDAGFVDQAIVAMDRWLAAVERDKRRDPARPEDHPGQARRRDGALHQWRRWGVARVDLRRRRAALFERAHRGGHGRGRRHDEVRAQAAAPGQLPGRPDRRPVRAPARRLPAGRVRLHQARGGSHAHRHMAVVRGRPWRQVARRSRRVTPVRLPGAAGENHLEGCGAREREVEPPASVAARDRSRQ